MTRATLRLTPRTDVWRAWVGFNLSHGLGCLVFGGLIILIGRGQASFTTEGRLFLPFAVAVSAAYLVLALGYWFRAPIIGCAISLACLLASWVAFGLGS